MRFCDAKFSSFSDARVISSSACVICFWCLVAAVENELLISAKPRVLEGDNGVSIEPKG